MGGACSKTPDTLGEHAPAKQVLPSATAAGAVDGNVATDRSKLREGADVRDVYRFGKMLGQGGFATVKLVTDKETGTQYACKVMKLPPVGAVLDPSEFTREDIFKEINILLKMDHPNVMGLKEYYVADDKVYLICELLTGGELLDAVLEAGHYMEPEARACFVQLLNGLQYLHEKGIVHRDLKLENLLLPAKGDTAHIKIADFGLAKKLEGTVAKTVCGTPQYVAPEVIMGGPGHRYGPKVDLWSAGVVLFILLAGYPPFYNESEPALFNQIRRGEYNFDDTVWRDVSEGAKDLVRSLLRVEPEQRLSAAEALAHPWIAES